MSEWSPGGTYSCPGTPNNTGRSFKSQWDEPEKGSKALNGNSRSVSENRNKTFQQHSMEDVSKTSATKLKKGNGTSDPRFKRVISSGIQNDACVGTDVKSSKPSLASQEKGVPMSKLSIWNIKDFKPNSSCIASSKNLEQPKLVSKGDNSEQQASKKLTSPEDPNFDQSHEHLKAVDKLKFNHDLVVNSLLKESLSDCTVNTRNTSLASEEFADELPSELRRVPSATRVKKVQNWIHDLTPKIEKKHSLITVIGQMQGPDTLSSALREIDKRRKLVKELDKYAVCKKITESDKENENYDVVSNINCLNTAERVLFPDSNETLITCYPRTNDLGDKLTKQSDGSNNGNNLNTCNDQNTDSTLPLSASRKSSSVKKKLKKSQLDFDCPIKGRLRLFFSNVHYQKTFCVLFLISGVLCWFAFLSVPSSCVPFDIFAPKPKPLTWYEKLCQWIWEFFRPSANYQRTTPWRTY